MHISEDVIRKVLVQVAAEMGPATPKRVVDIVNGGEGASFDGVRSQGIPMTFTFGDFELSLPEGLADNEEIPEGVRRTYNKALARSGQTDMLLPEYTVARLVRAHEWLWIQAGKPTGKPVKERKKPQPRPEVERNFLWRGVPVTDKQYLQRLRMSKNVVPENSGRIVRPEPQPEPEVVQQPKADKKAKKKRKKLIAACEILGVPAEAINALIPQ